MVARALQSLRLMISGGEIIRTDAEKHPLQAQIHGMDGEVLDRVPILGPYGVAYRPPAGARVLTAALGASREQLVILGAAHEDDRAPALEPGEVALYGRGGASVRLALDGHVYITGNVVAEGDVRDFRGSMELIRELFDAHTHPTQTGLSGPPTLPMRGGTSGAGASAGEAAGTGGDGNGEETETGELTGETGDVWYFDAAQASAVLLNAGPPGTFLMSRGRGMPLEFSLPPPMTDATYLTTGTLEGGTP